MVKLHEHFTLSRLSTHVAHMPLFIPATWGSYGLVINADAYAEPLMKASVGTKTPIVTTNPIEYSSNDFKDCRDGQARGSY